MTGRTDGRKDGKPTNGQTDKRWTSRHTNRHTLQMNNEQHPEGKQHEVRSKSKRKPSPKASSSSSCPLPAREARGETGHRVDHRRRSSHAGALRRRPAQSPFHHRSDSPQTDMQTSPAAGSAVESPPFPPPPRVSHLQATRRGGRRRRLRGASTADAIHHQSVSGRRSRQSSMQTCSARGKEGVDGGPRASSLNYWLDGRPTRRQRHAAAARSRVSCWRTSTEGIRVQ